MREDRAEALMAKFGELIREQVISARFSASYERMAQAPDRITLRHDAEPDPSNYALESPVAR